MNIIKTFDQLNEELLPTHKVTWNDAVDACINEIKKHEDKVYSKQIVI